MIRTYVLRAGPGLADAGKFYRFARINSPAGWHTDPAMASTFRNLHEAKRAAAHTFPTIHERIEIAQLVPPTDDAVRTAAAEIAQAGLCA